MLLERCAGVGDLSINKMQVATGVSGQKDRIVFEVSHFRKGYCCVVGSFASLEEAKEEARKSI